MHHFNGIYSNSTSRNVRGIVLLFVLGILALLAVLALTFINMTRLERNISLNYVYGVRATLVAESGIEYATNRLLAVAGGTITPAFSEDLAFEEGGKPGLQHAAKVSFNLPGSLDISGIVGDSLSLGGDFYKLRVTPEDGKLNLNDTNALWNLDTDPEPDSNDPAVDADAEAPFRLFKMVENLGDILFGKELGDLIGWDIANAIFSARDMAFNGRFSSMAEVKTALAGVLDDDNYKLFSRYVTLYSWQDPNTIRPTYKCVISVPDDSLRSIPSGSEHPFFSPLPRFEYDYRHDLYLWSDFQTTEFELEPRVPVNVNIAGVELLEALIAPLQGWYLREGPGSCTTFEPFGRLSWFNGSTADNAETATGCITRFATPNIQMQYYWGDVENRSLHGCAYDNGFFMGGGEEAMEHVLDPRRILKNSKSRAWVKFA
ncbi:hypothetical protein ACFL54_00030 [Planctomycetota bacterium]